MNANMIGTFGRFVLIDPKGFIRWNIGFCILKTPVRSFLILKQSDIVKVFLWLITISFRVVQPVLLNQQPGPESLSDTPSALQGEYGYCDGLLWQLGRIMRKRYHGGGDEGCSKPLPAC